MDWSGMSPVRSGRNAGPQFIIQAQCRSRSRMVKIAMTISLSPRTTSTHTCAVCFLVQKPVPVMEWIRFTLGSSVDNRKWDRVTRNACN